MKTARELGNDYPFAKKLRELLDNHPKKKIPTSKTQLAKHLNVKQQTVSQWALGLTTPSIEHLKPLASFFDISIDELVTGVAFEHENLHVETGLSNLAINILKELKNSEKPESKKIIEFLNILIETGKKYSGLPNLACRSIDYIVGANKHLLRQDEIQKHIHENYDFLFFIDRPNMENDELNFRTFQLTKDFEYFIVEQARDDKTLNRAKKIFEENGLDLPDYKDRHIEEILGKMGK